MKVFRAKGDILRNGRSFIVPCCWGCSWDDNSKTCLDNVLCCSWNDIGGIVCGPCLRNSGWYFPLSIVLIGLLPAWTTGFRLSLNGIPWISLLIVLCRTHVLQMERRIIPTKLKHGNHVWCTITQSQIRLHYWKELCHFPSLPSLFIGLLSGLHIQLSFSVYISRLCHPRAYNHLFSCITSRFLSKPILLDSLIFFSKTHTSHCKNMGHLVQNVLVLGLRYWSCFLVISIVGRLICNRYKPGLQDIPGPFLASLSDLWLFFHCLQGKSYKDYELHRKYNSNLLRLGPNTVSVADGEAVRIIYGWKPVWKKASELEQKLILAPLILYLLSHWKPHCSRWSLLQIEPALHLSASDK